jgi:hypothetical protein
MVDKKDRVNDMNTKQMRIDDVATVLQNMGIVPHDNNQQALEASRNLTGFFSTLLEIKQSMEGKTPCK